MSPRLFRPGAAAGFQTTAEPEHPGFGRWLVLAATVFWGTTATLARYVFRERGVPPFTVVELRLLIAVLLLGPWLAWRSPGALRVRREDWGYFVTLALFGVAAIQGSYYYSISVLGVGLAILIQYLAPALIVLVETLRGARASAATIAALLGAISGTALLVGGVDHRTSHAQPYQWAISFSSAFAFAFYIMFSKRGLRRCAPATVLFYTFLIAAAFWAIFTPPWKILAAGYDTRLWMLFLVLGVFSTLVPFTLFYSGLRRLPAAQTGILATLEPVVAVLSAALFLHEGLRAIQWAGAALVLAAAMLASGQTRGTATPRPRRG